MTQALCAVCAVSYDDVRAVAGAAARARPAVLSLDPETLDEVLDDLVTARPRRRASPSAASALRDRARAARLDAVAEAVAGAPRPRVAALEWLDPPSTSAATGCPEMIALAGGEDVLGEAGREVARRSSWEESRPRARRSSS